MLILLLLLLLPLCASAQPAPVWYTPFGGLYITWSPNGERLASISEFGVTFVDVASGKRQRDIVVKPQAAGFSADGSHMVMMNNALGDVMSYDVESGELSRSVRYQDTLIWTMIYSHDKSRACIWYTNGVVVVIDVETLDSIMTISVNDLRQVAISGDGNVIACIGGDVEGQNVAIYNVGEYQPRVRLGAGEHRIALNSTGDKIMTAAENGYLTLWSASTGEKLQQRYWSVDFEGSVALIRFDPKDANVLVYADDPCVFSVSDLVYRGRIPYYTSDPVEFSADGAFMMLYSEAEGYVVYSLITHSIIEKIDPFPGKVLTTALSPDGTTLALTLNDHTVRTYDLKTKVSTIILDRVCPHYSRTFPLANRIIGGLQRQLVTWDLDNGDELGRFDVSRYGLLFNFTDSEVWAETKDSITVLSIPNGQVIGRHLLPSTWIRTTIIFTDDTHFIGHFIGGTTRKVNVRTGEFVWTIPREYESSSTVSPTGEMFALVINDVIKVFNTADGELKREFRLARTPGIIDILFHPDNERLIAGTYGRDSGIRIWNINTGDLLYDLRGPESNVQKLTLHPDGVHLISTSTDTMCLWDIDRGVLLHKTELPTEVFRQGVLFNPTGDLFALSYRTYSQLWNTFNLQPVVTIPNWVVRSFDASGSRLVASRGHAGEMRGGSVASLSVLDILPYVITSVPVESTNSRTSSMMLAVSSNSPNSSTVVTINFTSASDQVLRLCDLTGRIIHTIYGSGSLDPQQFELDTADLPRGALFLHACDQGGSASTILYLTN